MANPPRDPITAEQADSLEVLTRSVLSKRIRYLRDEVALGGESFVEEAFVWTKAKWE